MHKLNYNKCNANAKQKFQSGKTMFNFAYFISYVLHIQKIVSVSMIYTKIKFETFETKKIVYDTLFSKYNYRLRNLYVLK